MQYYSKIVIIEILFPKLFKNPKIINFSDIMHINE